MKYLATGIVIDPLLTKETISSIVNNVEFYLSDGKKFLYETEKILAYFTNIDYLCKTDDFKTLRTLVLDNVEFIVIKTN